MCSRSSASSSCLKISPYGWIPSCATSFESSGRRRSTRTRNSPPRSPGSVFGGRYPSAGVGRGCYPVEEPPPQLERARDRPPHVRLERRGGRQADDDVVADRAVLAVRLLVHVPERDLIARAPVVPLEGAREGAERTRHLPLRGQVRRRGALDERVALGRALEPVDEGRRRREGHAAHHRVPRNTDALPEADEELGVRDVAARDAAGLLLEEALRELDPLPDGRTARVQRAHRARELADLEEELHGERAEGGAREPSLRDPEPERMAAEGAAGVDRRPQVLDERVVARHRPTSTPRRGRVSTSSARSLRDVCVRPTGVAITGSPSRSARRGVPRGGYLRCDLTSESSRRGSLTGMRTNRR